MCKMCLFLQYINSSAGFMEVSVAAGKTGHFTGVAGFQLGGIFFIGEGKMLRVAFVDDEEEVIEHMLGYVERYERENSVRFDTAVYRDGLDVLALNEFPDILFLDIEMKNLNGMRTAAEIRKRDEGCVIVFVTRMAQYAVEGYGVRALDFVVKPMTYETFAYKFRRAVEAASKRTEETVIVSSHGGKRRLFISDIDYVEVINHKIVYHLGEEIVEVWSSMKSVREQLEPYGFTRAAPVFWSICERYAPFSATMSLSERILSR